METKKIEISRTTRFVIVECETEERAKQLEKSFNLFLKIYKDIYGDE